MSSTETEQRKSDLDKSSAIQICVYIYVQVHCYKQRYEKALKWKVRKENYCILE